MGVLEAILLGIIQGLTEFLPVSSSGHIELGKEILGIQISDPLMFSVVVHAATALSTIVIFRKDIVSIFKGLLKFKWNDELKFTLLIIVSMVPAAFVGLFFEDQIESFFSGNIFLVGVMLLLTGGLLFLADKAKNTTKNVGFVDSIIIGISQAIAILPGISRSGATISTSVLLGIDRSKAARFSFLMVVPLILGAALLDVKKYKEISDLEQMDASARVEVIMEDLIKEETLNVAEVDVVKIALLKKEESWEALKIKAENNLGEGAIAQEVSLNENFTENLQIEVTEETISKINSNHLAKVRALSGLGIGVLLAGFLAAFLTGLMACTWMIKLVKKAKLQNFGFYCFLAGSAAIIYALF